MTNTQAYFENIVNLEHSVLGKTLKPFSILHYLWLQHIGSPLVITSKELTKADLELAVLICSSSSSEEILHKLNAPAPSFAWMDGRLWRFENRFRDIKQHTLRFLAYQDDYCSLPEFMSNEDDRDEKLPWLLLSAASLIKHTGWSEQTVMTMPLGNVIWLNNAFGYLQSGETSVVSDREKAAMQALRQTLTPAA